MNPNSEFHIFRDSRRQVRAAELVAHLHADLLRMPGSARLDDILNALLRAGELECALADSPAPEEDAAAASELTTRLAKLAVSRDVGRDPEDTRTLSAECLRLVGNIKFAGTVSLSPPEGFAHYALHPLDYADLVTRVKIRSQVVFVVGIRSIGTILSGVVCAKLRQLGINAERTTVRPSGHPYQRHCQFADSQRQAIVRARNANAEFIVCDEGPGRSGSSLLSVAEALEGEGVAADHILILCSHEPDVSSLCAPNAARRWRRYRCAAAGMTRRLPASAECCAGGGEWRRYLLGAPESWPAVWPQMERLTYVSSDECELLTFEGHGAYGAAAAARNDALSSSGLGPRYLGYDAGFGRHLMPCGPSLSRGLSSEVLNRIAKYCAWRAREFAVTHADASDLEQMAQTNFAREFGAELENFELGVERPAVCDNRMAPHYWLGYSDSQILKLDGAIHGDDHFFPGPCDIGWDLAGAIVEWELSPDARESLLAHYRRFSGDDIARRLSSYELAYAAFRLGWSKMAAASTPEAEENARLLFDARRYRRILQRLTGYRTRQSSPLRAAARAPQARETSAAPELL